MRRCQQRHHDRGRGAGRALGGRVGEDGADAIRVALARGVSLRQADIERGIIESDDGRDLGGRAGEGVAANARYGQHECW
ncbi:MAG TPA: hypothetical protein VN969_35780 [Streptosporangiaceae bacterium]|nr:hypothetical protein [Streptosporangiaceae bacterium]